MKTLFLGLLSLLTISTYASLNDLPSNFDNLNLQCSTWDSFESDSMEQSLEKFTISSSENGIRTITLNNSKNSYPCAETDEGLECIAYAYQINDDQLLEDVSENQKFRAIVTLDYSKIRNELIEGIAKVPSGFFGTNKKRSLYCEIVAERN